MGINDVVMKGARRDDMATERYGAEQIAKALQPMLDELIREQKRTNQLLEWLGGLVAPKQ